MYASNSFFGLTYKTHNFNEVLADFVKRSKTVAHLQRTYHWWFAEMFFFCRHQFVLSSEDVLHFLIFWQSLPLLNFLSLFEALKLFTFPHFCLYSKNFKRNVQCREKKNQQNLYQTVFRQLDTLWSYTL